MEELIEKHREFLVNRIEPDFGLLDKLLANTTLTRESVHRIKLKDNTTEDKNRILLDFTLKNKKANEFISALMDSGQSHLVNYLSAGRGYGLAFGDDWPLSESNLRKLDINRESLIDLLDTSDLCNRLYSEQVINNRQKQLIFSKPTDFEKNEALLDMMTRFSLRQYKKTIVCLHDCNQSHIADLFSEEGGVLVRVHANLEAADGNVDALEDEIITQFKRVLERRPLYEVIRLLDETKLAIIAVKKGQSIVTYIHCKTQSELLQLTDFLKTDKLKEIVERIFIEMLSIGDALTVSLSWSSEEFKRASTYFDTGYASLSRDLQFRLEVTERSSPSPSASAMDSREEGSPARMTESEIFKQPLCLVDSGPDGTMTVNKWVLYQLKGLDKEVVVVSIAGLYRTGKSYLMNKLAGQNKGFSIGSTVQLKTKGIWIWVTNHPVHSDKYIILLDTEGLGDVEKGDENHDHQILCLAVLLSSTLVYNDMSVKDNDVMMKLHFIAELSKHIQVRSNSDVGSKSDDSNFDFYFPDFVYAIRDLKLDLEIDKKEVTADEYLEHSLTMKEVTGPKVKNYNKIRSCIRRYFKKRKCFTFGRPMAKYRDLDGVTDDKLDPEFVKQTGAFLNYIFRESPVKTVQGKRLSGRMFGSLVEVYVEQMKTGVPYVENAVETMARLENTQAKDEASALYYNLMQESLKTPVDDDAEFSRCHNTCLQKSIDLFLSKAVFDNNHAFQRQMNEDITKKYNELVQLNENKCRDTCQTALKQLYEPIEENLKAGKYTRSGGFRLYKNDIRDFEETYKLKIGRIGVKMNHVLLEFLHSKQTEEDAIMKADEMVTEAEKKEEAERQKANEAQRLKEQADREVALKAQQLFEQHRAHEENISRLEKQTKEQFERAQKHHEEVLAHRLDEQQRLLQEGFKKKADQMCARIAEIQRQKESDDIAHKRHQEELVRLLGEQKEQQLQLCQKLEELQRQSERDSNQWREIVRGLELEKEKNAQKIAELERLNSCIIQ